MKKVILTALVAAMVAVMATSAMAKDDFSAYSIAGINPGTGTSSFGLGASTAKYGGLNVYGGGDHRDNYTGGIGLDFVTPRLTVWNGFALTGEVGGIYMQKDTGGATWNMTPGSFTVTNGVWNMTPGSFTTTPGTPPHHNDKVRFAGGAAAEFRFAMPFDKAQTGLVRFGYHSERGVNVGLGISF